MKTVSKKDIHDEWVKSINIIAKQRERIAELEQALRAAIPYIERLKAYCDDGDTICFDNTSDEQEAEKMQALLEQIKQFDALK